MSVDGLWVECYLGLGSNLDDPIQQVLSASEEIASLEGVEIIKCSPLYSSQPVGPQDQPDFVNAVLHIKTCLSSLDLLKQLQAIENQHARVRSQRWGARTLDLDILLYGNEIINLPDLIVPHPEIANRAFVLYPLADIASNDLVIPGKSSLNHLIQGCVDQKIRRLGLS
jgi:2-amino-4-hydroxy-6-hydroxymethyldihydropteridine diphosphokinase